MPIPNRLISLEQLIERGILDREPLALERTDLAGPGDVADPLDHPRNPQVLAAPDVDTDVGVAAGIAFRTAGARVLGGVDEIVVQPGQGLVEPLHLVFLPPQILVAQAGAHLLDVAWEAIGYRLMDIDPMPAPYGIGARHDLVELVALAVRGARDRNAVPRADDREQGAPDLARFLVARELIQKTFAEYPRAVSGFAGSAVTREPPGKVISSSL